MFDDELLGNVTIKGTTKYLMHDFFMPKVKISSGIQRKLSYTKACTPLNGLNLNVLSKFLNHYNPYLFLHSR